MKWRLLAFLLSLCAARGIAADETVKLPFVAVPAEQSGVTHKVQIRSKTVKEGIKYPWMSPLVDINCAGPTSFGSSCGWFCVCLAPPKRASETRWTNAAS